MIACIDGLTGFPDAIKSVFPQTDIQLCIIHQIRNSMKYVGSKHRKEFMQDLKPVYKAATKEAAELELDKLEGKWGEKYPIVIRSWRDKWDNLSSYFQYREHLKSDGTIWISGTYHNIFSVARCLDELDFKILNCITWVKTSPPPNLSCRYFTYSAEYILWARKEQKVAHYYNYELMKEINGGTQMRDVWTLPAIAPWEKSCGKHPTQKPLCVLSRIIQASTKPGAWVLDPFTGSSTTGIAANLLGRRFLGIDQEEKFLEMSKSRREELNSINRRKEILEKLEKQAKLFQDSDVRVLGEPAAYYGSELPF